MRLLLFSTTLILFLSSHAQTLEESNKTEGESKKQIIEKLGGSEFRINMSTANLRDRSKTDLNRAPLSFIESQVKREVNFIKSTEQNLEDWSNTDYPIDSGPVLYASGAYGVYGERDVSSLEPGDYAGENKLRNQINDLGREQTKKLVKDQFKKQTKDIIGNKPGGMIGGQIGGMIANDLFGSKEDEEKRRVLKEQIMTNDKYFAKYELMEEFEELLEDADMSIVATQPTTYFFIVNIEHPYGISFSLFDLKPSTYNQLPYKVEVLKKYKEDTKRDKNFLYGPFKTLSEAREKIDVIAYTAYLAFWKVAPDVGFSYNADQTTATSNEVDFWGTKKKTDTKKEEPVSTDDDFWGVKKEDNK
ncbi:MAG: hypothetical protein RIF46_14370 [Cyclobacteriaceae bacterium]